MIVWRKQQQDMEFFNMAVPQYKGYLFGIIPVTSMTMVLDVINQQYYICRLSILGITIIKEKSL